jgi:hypothetical protein
MKNLFACASIVAFLAWSAACGNTPQQAPPAGQQPAATQPAGQALAPGTDAPVPQAAPAPVPAGQAPAPTAAPATRPAPAPAAGTAPAGAGATAAPPATATAPPPEPVTAPPPEPPKPEYREYTVPEGTTLSVVLETDLASDTSKVEDAVRGRLAKSVTVNGRQVIANGARLTGSVTEVKESGKVKGLARIGFRFTTVNAADERHTIRTATVVREAKATKGDDAKKIGIGAGVGAIIGGIAGGGKGAAIGAGVGGGAGTGVVMATRGEEVRLPAGTTVSVKLTQPLTIRLLEQPDEPGQPQP